MSAITSPVHHTCDAQQAQVLREQVDRILRSPHFNGSELLRNLLSYLAKRAIDLPGEAVKEYEVAVDVLGRDPAFDSRQDSAVRVHTARLRAKLAEYYMAEGAEDALVIEVPKGSYLVTWRIRGFHTEPAMQEAMTADAHTRFAWKPFWAGAGAAALLGALAWGVFALAAPRPPSAIQTFWRSFNGKAPDPIVAFSNHRFVGTSVTGLHSYREGVDSPSEINDTYSGTGTVMAVQEIGSLFSSFHRGIRLKRAELLTWDDAKTTNVILAGAPDANSPLRQLRPLEYFEFKSSRIEPRMGIGGIVNRHPRPGEQPIYFGSTVPFPFDYAVIAMVPGLKPDYRILVLAATNTYGLQAAADFVCRADLVANLLGRLNIAAGARVPDFEALLEVNISGGVPVKSNLFIVRKRGS